MLFLMIMHNVYVPCDDLFVYVVFLSPVYSMWSLIYVFV